MRCVVGDCDLEARCDECGACEAHCYCLEDDYDADELGLDPEEPFDYA